MADGPSDKSRGVALALSLVLGFAGAHRFYAGKTGSALLMLVTVGGLGIWWLYDIILIAGGGFTDAEGRPILNWDSEQAALSGDRIPEAVLDELQALRDEVAELAERVDFTERLLAAPRAPESERVAPARPPTLRTERTPV